LSERSFALSNVRPPVAGVNVCAYDTSAWAAEQITVETPGA
jgi:hypothetical protein